MSVGVSACSEVRSTFNLYLMYEDVVTESSLYNMAYCMGY